MEDAIATGLAVVKIAAGDVVKDKQAATIDGKALTVVADPGAKLDRDGDGPIIQVQGAGADVSIVDLEITGASGVAGADGIDVTPNGGTPKLTLTRVTIDVNQGIGVSASGSAVAVSHSTFSGNTGGGISVSGGSLTVTQSTLSANTGGGVSITGSQYQLFNNFIVTNGSPSNAFGGVQIAQIGTAGMHAFQFNTVASNVAIGTNTAGVVCSLVGTPLMFANNIAFKNSSPAQVEGNNCAWTYSDIGPSAVPGTGNINADPMFAAPLQGNFHLLTGSAARRAADPNADLTGLVARDFDGDARVAPADLGADQVK